MIPKELSDSLAELGRDFYARGWALGTSGNFSAETYGDRGGLTIEGFEMLKSLAGVRTHRHREWLPILENSQDYGALAQNIERVLGDHPSSHAFLLRRHGLYAWGRDLMEAKRHVEIMEFLMEVLGRTDDGQR